MALIKECQKTAQDRNGIWAGVRVVVMVLVSRQRPIHQNQSIDCCLHRLYTLLV
jgi:hypothetical protein